MGLRLGSFETPGLDEGSEPLGSLAHLQRNCIQGILFFFFFYRSITWHSILQDYGL